LFYFYLFLVEKRVDINVSLFQYCSEGSFRHIAWMIRNGCVSFCFRIAPNFMAPGCLAQKLKSGLFQDLDNLPLFVPR